MNVLVRLGILLKQCLGCYTRINFQPLDFNG